MTTPSSDAGAARLSAWQRWELGTLDPRSGQQPDPAAQQAALERARAAAAEAGRRAGYAEGRAAAAAEQARLTRLAETFADQAGSHAQRLADEVLDLALVVARHLVGEALSVRRELVLPVVANALKQLPQSTQRVQIVLNPADVELVRSYIGRESVGERCDLLPDPAIAPGGVRVESEHAEIDATITTRWRRVLAGLGRSDDWLEPA